MWNKIMKEVKLGRCAGPFDRIPFESYIQSPLGLVPKAGGQTRLIFHLSYNFGEKWEQKSLNFHTPEHLCTVKYRDLDYTVRTCLKLNLHLGADRVSKNRYFLVNDQQMDGVTESVSSSGLYMAKSDLKSAFRNLPILVSQQKFLIMKCKHPKTKKLQFFVEKCLPFGASISCKRFQDFSDCLHHILEFAMDKKFRTTNYLDDYFFIEETEQLSNQMVRNFLRLCQDIGCPVALEKTEWASQTIVFLGILLNGKTYTLSIPEEKKYKALKLLNWVIQQRTVTIKVIQRPDRNSQLFE